MIRGNLNEVESSYLTQKPKAMEGEARARTARATCSLSTSPVTSTLCESETEELQRMPLAPQFVKSKKRLSKQLSLCRTPRDVAWERRRLLERRRGSSIEVEKLTDDDFHELKGCIELGFGFNEQGGQSLCNTLPALDLYFAVNRQLNSPSPVSTPSSRESSSSICPRSDSFGSSKSDSAEWKICSPGDNPQQVKTRIRHWAQAVACSVMQSYRDVSEI